MSTIFSYYELKLRLREPLLATNASSPDIQADHVIEKSRKQIALANNSHKKLVKTLKRFVGDAISVQSEIEELKGIIRVQQELLAVHEDIPNSVSEIVKYSEDLEERLAEKFENQELYKSTVFLRDEAGNACISTHMILGNIKSILNVVTNGAKKEDKEKNIFKSKVQLNESMSLDIKFTEKIIPASNPIMRHENGERNLNVRPIRFNRMGQTVTAIASSEQLKAGTTFNTVLRIRKGSPVDNIEVLKFIFGHGKNLGLGSWRNSNQYGTYDFKLELLTDYSEKLGRTAGCKS